MMFNYFWHADCTEKQTAAFKVAIAAGRKDLVKKYVAEGCDPNVDNGYAIIWSCRYNLDMLKLLLTYDNIDPSVDSNIALEILCKENLTEYITLILYHPNFRC